MNNDALTAARALAPIDPELAQRNGEPHRRLAEPIVDGPARRRACAGWRSPRSCEGSKLPTPRRARRVRDAGLCRGFRRLDRVEQLVAVFPRPLSRRRTRAARSSVIRNGYTRAPRGRPAKPTIDGDGYRVDGRWSLVSGCELAEWIMLLCVVEENGKPRMVGAERSRDALRVRAPRRLRDPRYLARRRPARHGQSRRRREGRARSARAHVVARRSEHARRAAWPHPDHLLDGRGVRRASARRRPTRRRHARRAHEDEGLPRLGRARFASDRKCSRRSRGTARRSTRRASICARASTTLWRAAAAGAPRRSTRISAVWAGGLHAADAGQAAVEAMYAAGGTSRSTPIARSNEPIATCMRCCATSSCNRFGSRTPAASRSAPARRIRSSRSDRVREQRLDARPRASILGAVCFREVSMKLVTVAIAAIGLVVAPALAQAPRGAVPAGAIHVEPAVILDATGFEAPMAASTLFLPRGWQTQGGVYWAREYMCTNGYNFLWTATSPDGATSINVLPQERWETNNVNGQPSTPGCQSAPYTTTAAVSRKRGAALAARRPRPRLPRARGSAARVSRS